MIQCRMNKKFLTPEKHKKTFKPSARILGSRKKITTVSESSNLMRQRLKIFPNTNISKSRPIPSKNFLKRLIDSLPSMRSWSMKIINYERRI